MSDQPQPLHAAVYARQSSGKTKSITDQDAACTADATAHGWQVVGHYQDTTSASRYATRARPGHEQLLADLAAARLGVVVIWEPSRGDRTLASWAAFLELCREHGVLIRVTDHARTYDMGEARDWRTLAEDGVDSGYESEKISRRTRRGVASAARNGRPPQGPCPYGYRRTYAPADGKLTGQEPDPVTAPVVRSIFADVARSVPISAITDRLNRDEVPPPGVRSHRTGSKRWYRQRVRLIALNPAYAGLRKHNGTTWPGGWPPLVDPEVFYTAARMLGEPARFVTARPGRQRHLLTYLATCWRGHPLTARATYYVCNAGCVNVVRAQLDGLVEAAAVEALADPKVYQRLRRHGELSDREATAARNEVAQLRGRLADYRTRARAGKVDPDDFAEIAAGLRADIAAAQARGDRAGLPPALRPFLAPGADVEARWDAATVQARRDVIRVLMTVTVRPVGRRSGVPVADRVDIRPPAARLPGQG